VRWSELFPRDWRERYGEEIDDLLARSRRPIRDRLDLLISAIGAHRREAFRLLAERPRLLKAARALACLFVLIGIASGLSMQPRLSHGLLEIPGHWWSTIAVLPTILGLGLASVSWRRRPA
jgi:hypothetical protein